MGMHDHQPLRAIRKLRLIMSQAEIAAITATAQSTVSRWERGEIEPNRAQMAAIREYAIKKGIEWRDEWFFEPVSAAPAVQPDERIK